MLWRQGASAAAVQQRRMAPGTLSGLQHPCCQHQLRSNHCACPGDMNLPAPSKVLVEYHPEEVDTFIEFADATEDEFGLDVVVEGEEVNSPGSPAFHITLEGGAAVFSCANSGALPPYEELFALLRKAGLSAAPAAA